MVNLVEATKLLQERSLVLGAAPESVIVGLNMFILLHALNGGGFKAPGSYSRN